MDLQHQDQVRRVHNKVINVPAEDDQINVLADNVPINDLVVVLAPAVRALEIIHLEQVLECLDLRVLVEVVDVLIVDRWQDRVLVRFVLDLLHDHNVLINDRVDHHVLDKVAEDLVADKVLEEVVHIVRKVAAEVDNVPVVLVREDQAVHVLVAHSVKVAERRRVIRVRKLAAKRSTIWKRQHWVGLLSHAVMETLPFVCAAVPHLLTSQRRLAQIPRPSFLCSSISERW